MKKRRVYEEIRSLVKELKGKMFFERAGYQWGAWIVIINGKRRVLRSNGSGYPDLDKLYKPKPGLPPKHWHDYTTQLLPGAREQLIELISEKVNEEEI